MDQPTPVFTRAGSLPTWNTGVKKQDQPRTLPGAHGRPDSLAELGGPHPFLPPQCRRGPQPLPGETTILNFRHLLEHHSLGEVLLSEINAHLESQGLKLQEGTIVDATIIEAPSPTKNRARERDPEMRQIKKGNQWHFGMKAHIGVDSETGIGHSMSATAANAHDVTEAHNLLHGGETVVWDDAGYQGVHKREKNLGLEVEWQVAMRPGRRRKLEPESEEALAEKVKASVRAKSLPSTPIGGGASVSEVEASVRIRQEPAPLQNGVRYRGLMKNTERLALLFGLGNLLTAASQLRA